MVKLASHEVGSRQDEATWRRIMPLIYNAERFSSAARDDIAGVLSGTGNPPPDETQRAWAVLRRGRARSFFLRATVAEWSTSPADLAGDAPDESFHRRAFFRDRLDNTQVAIQILDSSIVTA